MKLKSYLEKKLKKAIKHQDAHPLSNSAALDVLTAKLVLDNYNSIVLAYKKDKK